MNIYYYLINFCCPISGGHVWRKRADTLHCKSIKRRWSCGFKSEKHGLSHSVSQSLPKGRTHIIIKWHTFLLSRTSGWRQTEFLLDWGVHSILNECGGCFHFHHHRHLEFLWIAHGIDKISCPFKMHAVMGWEEHSIKWSYIEFWGNHPELSARQRILIWFRSLCQIPNYCPP